VGPTVPDGEGGFTQTPTVLASRVAAAVVPATAQALERLTANTVASSASHLVTLRYRAGITTQTALVFHDGPTDRPMAITGLYDPEERHVELVLACVESIQ
jgi:head-tail adaptor